MNRLMNRRWVPGFSMALLLAGGFVVLALLVLAPDYAQARLEGSQPVPLKSGLQADYSMDPMDLVIQPVDIKVVEQVIIDRTTSTSLPPRQQGETAIGALKTPVYTITPTPVQTRPAAGSPTRTAQNATNTAPAFTPTGATGGTKIVPLTPTTSIFIESQTATLTLTASATQLQGTIPPNSSRTSTASATQTPRPTSTMVPTPYGKTATPSSNPTIPPKSTLTPTQTPLPATAVVTLTFSPTPVSVTPQPPTRTFTPTRTYTPTRTPTRTYTPTRTPTRTYTPTRTPTPVSYPPPSTKTGAPTLPPYP